MKANNVSLNKQAIQINNRTYFLEEFDNKPYGVLPLLRIKCDFKKVKIGLKVKIEKL